MPDSPVIRLRAGDAEGISPTRLVLYAAMRTAHHYDLPGYDQIQTLVEQPNDTLAMYRLAKGYAALARTEVERSDAGRRWLTDFDVSIESMRMVLGATTMVWKVRQAAQGSRAAAPSMESWELLVMIITVLYGRARENATTHGLVTWVDDLAMEIAGL